MSASGPTGADNNCTLFSAIVLAGERPGVSPVAEAAGVCCKALAEVAGQPMVSRVLDALEQSQSIGRKMLCGLPKAALAAVPVLDEALATGRIDWQEGVQSPSGSAFSALQQIDPSKPVLLTTADHALLTPQMVDHFCCAALASGADLVVAVASYSAVSEAFPGVRRTVTRLSDDGYCGCNLFAFMTPEARKVADIWRRVEQQRKRPWRLVSIIGWGSVLRYLLGRLSLQQALERLSGRFGLRIDAVVMPQPEASVDVDTVRDWKFARRLAERQV